MSHARSLSSVVVRNPPAMGTGIGCGGGMGVDRVGKAGAAPIEPWEPLPHGHSLDAWDGSRPAYREPARPAGREENMGREPQRTAVLSDQPEPARRLSCQCVGLDVDLLPPLSVLACLTAVDDGGRRQEKAACECVRRGIALLSAEGQALASGLDPEAVKAARTLAAKLWRTAQAFAGDDRRAAVQLDNQAAWRKLWSSQAWVQRVLRESYLLQNDALLAYAQAARDINERRRKTRDLLERARQTKISWAASARTLATPEKFLADTPFAWREIDENSQEVGRLMTAEDVATWQEISRAARGDVGTGACLSAYADLRGPSRLSEQDRQVLDALIAPKGWGRAVWDGPTTDNFIRDRLGEVTSRLARMNQTDMDQYLVPIFGLLAEGKTDADALLDIFRAMNPVQLTHVLASGTASTVLRAARDLNSCIVASAVAAAPLQAIAGLALQRVAQEGLSTEQLADLRCLVNEALQQVGAELGEKVPALPDREDSGVGSIDLGTVARGAAAAVGGWLLNIADAHNWAVLGEAARRARAPAAAMQDAAAVARQLLFRLEAEADQEAKGANDDPTLPVIGSPKAVRTVSEMESYIRHLEDQLSGMGDDAQLAQLDLQNALQRQQQTLQMLTNLPKMLHETAMAVVRRLGL